VFLRVAAACLALAALVNANSTLFPEPYHNSALTGEAYVQELLNSSNPHRFEDIVGVPRSIFLKMLEILANVTEFKDSRDVSMEEQLVIFLYFGRTNADFRHIADRFNRSTDTISRCVFVGALGQP
jgi:hypothetical protein